MLLATKTIIPQLRSQIIGRERLLHLLERGMAGALTLVSAPAGSGKTSLVCQWARQVEAPLAWYSIDQEERSSEKFFVYLLHALGAVVPALEQVLRSLLQVHSPLTGKDCMPDLILSLGKLDTKVYLVLDDYHLLQAEEIDEALQLLLNHCNGKLHLTLVTRHDPDIPLARLRGAGLLTEVRGADLVFSEQEAERFFSETMEIPLATDQVVQLCQKTEGWAIGLQLAGLARKGQNADKPVPDKLSLNNQFLSDYFFEEVIAHQPLPVQEFLYRTSILERLHPDLCRELTDCEDGRKMLRHLERSNLFLLPLEEGSEWYRYHHLAAEWLQAKLENTMGEALGPLHKLAATWFTREGYLEQAFHHARLSKDMDFFAEILEDNIFTLIGRYDLQSALRWLNRVPSHVAQRHFLIKLYLAWTNLLLEEIKTTEDLLEEISACFTAESSHYPASKYHHGWEMLSTMKAWIRLYYDFSTDLIPDVDSALQRTSPNNVICIGILELLAGQVYLKNANCEAASRRLTNAISHLVASECLYFSAYAVTQQANVLRLYGRLRDASKMVMDTLEWIKDNRFTNSQAIANNCAPLLARILFDQNRLDEALELTSQSIEQARRGKDRELMIRAYTLEALIVQSKGETERADSLMQQVSDIAEQTHSTTHIRFVELEALKLAVIQSRYGSLEKWFAKRDFSIDEPFSLPFEKECLLLARLYLAQGKCQEAVDLLDHLRGQCWQYKRFDSILWIDVIRASALRGVGDRDAALTALQGAVEFSRVEGYVRPFIEHADHISDLLMELMEEVDERVRPFLTSLEKAIWLRQGFSAGNSRQESLIDPLTQRELQILRMIVAGLKNTEIAEATFVSKNTIKTHVRNIFRKLDTDSRVGAIMKAKEFGLA